MVIARKLLTVLLFAPLAGAADQALLDFIMPDARVVFGADISRMNSSSLNATLSQGVRSANPELQKLMGAAGFDPLRDLQEVLFASPGLGKNPPALLVARGTFNNSKLTTFAESAGSKITDFGGVPILSDPDKDSGAFALLDNIILAGNKEQVQAAISRRGRGVILNTEMAMRIHDLSQRYDAWLISIAPLATLAANLPEEARVEGLTTTDALRAIEQFSLGMGLNTDLKLNAEMIMTNAKSAAALAESIQLSLGMLQKNAKEAPGLMSALQNLNIGVDENQVHVGFTVPAPEVEKVVAAAISTEPKNAGLLTAAVRPAPPVPEPVSQVPTVEPAPVSGTPELPATEAQELIPEAPQLPLTALPVAAQWPPAPPAPDTGAPTVVTRSPRIPANGEILIQSSPKDMGTVIIISSKKERQ